MNTKFDSLNLNITACGLKKCTKSHNNFFLRYPVSEYTKLSKVKQNKRNKLPLCVKNYSKIAWKD